VLDRLPLRSRRSRMWSIAAACAAAALILAFWRRPTGERADDADPASIAVIAEMRGSVSVQRGGADVACAPSTALRRGDRVITGAGGSAVIAWRGESTTFAMAADGEARLEGGDADGKRVRLDGGSIAAQVAKQPAGRPLVLSTPHGAITVIGTRFTATVSVRATRLSVDEGRVAFARTAEADVVEIAAGGSSEAAAVVVAPGSALQAEIDAHPPGTTFVIGAGLHRLQQATPKDGDAFIGEPGAVLSGALALTALQADGAWTAAVPPLDGQVHGYCEPGYEGSRHPEDLFIDDRPLTRVLSADAVGPGRWFYDREAGLARFADDPAGKRLELSFARRAFAGPATGVTIRGLTVEKYAVPPQMGAIGDQYPAQGWTVRDCEIRWNHGVGIGAASGWTVVGNDVHDNGEMGVCGGGLDILVEGNRIAGNNFARFSGGWEGGGAKFVGTTALIVRGNRIVGNRGCGIITEGGCRATRYEDNAIADNTGIGIVHTCSHAAVIAKNRVSRNSRAEDVWLWGAQVLVRNSRGVEVADNVVVVAGDRGDGICLMQQDQSDGQGGRWLTADCRVHDNHITHESSPVGVSGAAADDAEQEMLAAGNRFDRNHYHVTDVAASHWMWGGFRTWDAFRAAGHEAAGTLDTDVRSHLADVTR
jgi:hypothetical protein